MEYESQRRNRKTIQEPAVSNGSNDGKVTAIMAMKKKDVAAVKIKYLQYQLQWYCFYWSENYNCSPPVGTGTKGWKRSTVRHRQQAVNGILLLSEM